MALPMGNYTAFKVDLVLSYPRKKKEIQKGLNICSHRLTLHLLLLQKHWEVFQRTSSRRDTPPSAPL